MGEYKKPFENGALSEELKDTEDWVDWDLIMEAHKVLVSQVERQEYEQRNLMPHAQLQLTGLRVYHEALVREAAIAAKAAAEAAALAEEEARLEEMRLQQEAEEEAKNPKKKGKK